jgi:hypothetical protein
MLRRRLDYDYGSSTTIPYGEHEAESVGFYGKPRNDNHRKCSYRDTGREYGNYAATTSAEKQYNKHANHNGFENCPVNGV